MPSRLASLKLAERSSRRHSTSPSAAAPWRAPPPRGLRTGIPSGPEPHDGTRPLACHIVTLERVAYRVPPQIDEVLDEVLAYENYRRVKVRWVTPLGEHVASISKRCSSSSRPSHRRSPRPRTMGTTAMCM